MSRQICHENICILSAKLKNIWSICVIYIWCPATFSYSSASSNIFSLKKQTLDSYIQYVSVSSSLLFYSIRTALLLVKFSE